MRGAEGVFLVSCSGEKYMQVALDLKIAHNEYSRRAAQHRLAEHETAQPNSAAWMDL